MDGHSSSSSSDGSARSGCRRRPYQHHQQHQQHQQQFMKLTCAICKSDYEVESDVVNLYCRFCHSVTPLDLAIQLSSNKQTEEDYLFAQKIQEDELRREQEDYIIAQKLQAEEETAAFEELRPPLNLYGERQ